MLACNNPTSTRLFALFEYPAPSGTPGRLHCVVNRRKSMNLVMNVESGIWKFSGLCGCGMSNRRDRFIVRLSVRNGDWDLEGQVLEFMNKSKKPTAFPSKKELIEAGRMDLVLGIEKEGGWLALGWNSEDVVVDCGGDVAKDWEGIVASQHDSKVSERSSDEDVVDTERMMEDESTGLGSESSPASSSSGGTLEEATGIEGILSRLEKKRSSAFGVSIQELEILDHALNDNVKKDRGTLPYGSPSNTTVARHEGRHDKGTDNYLPVRSQDTDPVDYRDSVNNVSPDIWRAWSNQRAGISENEFEAADISFDTKNYAEVNNVLRDKMLAATEGRKETVDRRTDSIGNQYSSDFIKSRLRSLELELSATLQSLKSKSDEPTLAKMIQKSEDLSEEMHNASDALEFKQTEIMHAKDALRSIRAKLAVLEGRMTMAVIDAKKMVEVKQKKIDQARHALHLLRNTSIIWPNSASEVLLAGSFDGWTTQRRMEKSASGIHSLSLMLYPGSYEIKFIVDGIWMIDPLRPITSYNGFQNNLLVVY